MTEFNGIRIVAKDSERPMERRCTCEQFGRIPLHVLLRYGPFTRLEINLVPVS